MIWIGTSGWQYRDWRGSFYPQGLPQRSWLAHYATRFPTVELNNSFYRLPEADTFRRWRDTTPDGFLMTVKASRYLTHVLRLRESEEPLQRLWSRVRELGPRCGPLLFQLPPRFAADPERLHAFVELLPVGCRAAFEFRDPSWHCDAVYAVLGSANAALVWPDRAGVAPDLPMTSGWAYLRLHQGQPDRPSYTRARLRDWADRIAALTAADVWVYFNNDEQAAAPHDATTITDLLRERVGDRVARVPEDV